ncbi:hypothetical protein AcW1_009002 [Taiwanofungus camphoratus]|nr:hypothetical protein AcW1_009002 [Antrodia cinnamomea]
MANSDPTVPLPSSYLPSIHTGLFSSWPSSAALAPTHAQGTASQSINSSSRTNDFGGEYGDHQPTRPLHPCWELPPARVPAERSRAVAIVASGHELDAKW